MAVNKVDTETIDPISGITQEKSSKPQFKKVDLSAAEQFAGNPNLFAPQRTAAGTDFGLEDYTFFGDSRFEQATEAFGNINPFTQDFANLRAEAQPWTHQAANFLWQAAGQVIGGSVQGIGYLAGLPAALSAGVNSEQEFGQAFVESLLNNPIAQGGENIMEWTRETAPIYAVNPGTFNPGDSGWWFSNGVSIASSLSLMIPAMGVSKGLSLLGKGAKLLAGASKSRRIKAGVEGTLNFLQGGSRISNQMIARGVTQATISRHMENMMEASGTYETTYQDAIAEGATEKQAREIAADAASKNYQLGWAMLGQDILQYGLMAKFKIPGTTATNKIEEALYKGMGNSKVAQFFNKNRGIGNGVTQFLSEGAEEAYQFIAAQEAQYSAMYNAGLIDETKLGERLGDYAQDGEMWTSAFFGGFGGLVSDAFGGRAQAKELEKFQTKQLEWLKARGGTFAQMANNVHKADESGNINDMITARLHLNVNMTTEAIDVGQFDYHVQQMEELAGMSNEQLAAYNAEHKGMELTPEFRDKVLPVLIAQSKSIGEKYEAALDKGYESSTATLIAAKEYTSEFFQERAKHNKTKLDAAVETEGKNIKNKQALNLALRQQALEGQLFSLAVLSQGEETDVPAIKVGRDIASAKQKSVEEELAQVQKELSELEISKEDKKAINTLLNISDIQEANIGANSNELLANIELETAQYFKTSEYQQAALKNAYENAINIATEKELDNLSKNLKTEKLTNKDKESIQAKIDAQRTKVKEANLAAAADRAEETAIEEAQDQSEVVHATTQTTSSTTPETTEEGTDAYSALPPEFRESLGQTTPELPIPAGTQVRVKSKQFENRIGTVVDKTDAQGRVYVQFNVKKQPIPFSVNNVEVVPNQSAAPQPAQAPTSTTESEITDKKANIERRRQEELLGKSFTATTEKVVTGKGQSAGKTIVRFTESKISSDGEVLIIKPKAKFKNEDTPLTTTPETITVKEFREQFYENLSEQDKEMFDEFFTDDSTRIKLVEARIGLKGNTKGQVNIDVESLEGQPFGFELQKGKEINAKYDTERAALQAPVSDKKADNIKTYVKTIFDEALKPGRAGYMNRVREKLTQVKEPTLVNGKKYVRVVTDSEANVEKIEIVTGTGNSYDYTFMSGFTGSGATKSTGKQFPTFIDENGKESGVMAPERLGDFFELLSDAELSALEQQATPTQQTQGQTIEQEFEQKKAEIENQITAVKNAKTKDELIKASEQLIGINPYDAGAVSMGTRAALMTPGSFERGKELFLQEVKGSIEAKKQAELSALKKQFETRSDGVFVGRNGKTYISAPAHEAATRGGFEAEQNSITLESLADGEAILYQNNNEDSAAVRPTGGFFTPSTVRYSEYGKNKHKVRLTVKNPFLRRRGAVMTAEDIADLKAQGYDGIITHSLYKQIPDSELNFNQAQEIVVFDINQVEPSQQGETQRTTAVATELDALEQQPTQTEVQEETTEVPQETTLVNGKLKVMTPYVNNGVPTAPGYQAWLDSGAKVDGAPILFKPIKEEDLINMPGVNGQRLLDLFNKLKEGKEDLTPEERYYLMDNFPLTFVVLGKDGQVLRMDSKPVTASINRTYKQSNLDTMQSRLLRGTIIMELVKNGEFKTTLAQDVTMVPKIYVNSTKYTGQVQENNVKLFDDVKVGDNGREFVTTNKNNQYVYYEKAKDTEGTYDSDLSYTKDTKHSGEVYIKVRRPDGGIIPVKLNRTKLTNEEAEYLVELYTEIITNQLPLNSPYNNLERLAQILPEYETILKKYPTYAEVIGFFMYQDNDDVASRTNKNNYSPYPTDIFIMSNKGVINYNYHTVTLADGETTKNQHSVFTYMTANNPAEREAFKQFLMSKIRHQVNMKALHHNEAYRNYMIDNGKLNTDVDTKQMWTTKQMPVTGNVTVNVKATMAKPKSTAKPKPAAPVVDEIINSEENKENANTGNGVSINSETAAVMGIKKNIAQTVAALNKIREDNQKCN